MVMAISINFFQQLSGINLIMFYALVMFKALDFGNDASLLSTVLTGFIAGMGTWYCMFYPPIEFCYITV